MRVHRFECGLPPQKLITGKTHRRIEKDFFLSTIKKQRERNQKGKDMKIRQINSGDVTHSIVTIFNSTLLYVLKLLRE